MLKHSGIPRSLEFLQQSGRGGRSISRAYSLLLSESNVGKAVAMNEMKKYAVASNNCGRSILNDHFSLGRMRREVF